MQRGEFHDGGRLLNVAESVPPAASSVADDPLILPRVDVTPRVLDCARNTEVGATSAASEETL